MLRLKRKKKLGESHTRYRGREEQKIRLIEKMNRSARRKNKSSAAGVHETVGQNAETENREKTERDLQQVYMRQKGTMLKRRRGNGLKEVCSRFT